MNYYIINNIALQSDIELNESNGYPSATKITATAYNNLLKGSHIIENNKVVLKPVYVPSLAELKQTKLSQLDAYIYSILSSGYTDTVTGWVLFTSENDVSNYATLKNAIVDMSANAVVEIGTYQGWQTSTKSVVYPLLVRYSAYMLPITTNYLKLKSYIEYAQDEATLEQITW
jgi:hypothetical protein